MNLLCHFMLNAFLYLLCQKLCWHNVDIPTSYPGSLPVRGREEEPGDGSL